MVNTPSPRPRIPTHTMSAPILSERQQLQFLQRKERAEEEKLLAIEQSAHALKMAEKKKAAKAKAKMATKALIKANKEKQRAKDKAKKKRAKEKKAATASSSSSSSTTTTTTASKVVKKNKNPTKALLAAQIRIILKSADMQSMTAKTVRKSLEKLFGCDLKPRKTEVTEILKECINNPEATKRGGYSKVYQVSTRLSNLLGSDTELVLTRNDLSKQIVEYMKAHDCQNQADKREFVLNAPLKAIFKIKKMTYFSINKHIGQELTDTNPAAKPKKRKASSSSSSSSSKAGTKKKGGTKRKKGAAGKGANKKQKKAKDPNHPKRGKNSYMFFMGEKRGAIAAAHPEDGVGAIAKKIGVLWGELSDKRKAPFEAMAAKDKTRYAAALAQYKKTSQYADFVAANE